MPEASAGVAIPSGARPRYRWQTPLSTPIIPYQP